LYFFKVIVREGEVEAGARARVLPHEPQYCHIVCSGGVDGCWEGADVVAALAAAGPHVHLEPAGQMGRVVQDIAVVSNNVGKQTVQL
jgi:hypothetical protein